VDFGEAFRGLYDTIVAEADDGAEADLRNIEIKT
jgi:hypothetical protein